MPDDNTTDDLRTPEVPQDADVQPADDAQEANGDESALDPKAKSALEKVRREAASLRKRLKDIEPAARRLKELEDKDKSETERLTGQLAELQTKVVEYEVREVRAAAAAAVGLPATMAQFITATDLDEAKAQAKALVDFGKAGQSADFKQGARPNTAKQPTGDEFIRGMAGRQ